MTAGAIDAALAAETDVLAQRLLALRGSQWFHRKFARIKPKRLAESIVAFANADGGRDHLLVIEVPPGRNVYATNRDEAYMRLGDESRKLSFVRRRELFHDKSHSAFEPERTDPRVSDIDRDLLGTDVSALAAPDAIRLLEDRELVVDSNLTVAGTPLFEEHPERVLLSAQARVSRVQGTRRESGSRQDLIGDERLEGPVLRLLAAVRRNIHRWQPVRRALAASGRFEDVGPVPEDAWLEGVDAVVHRSYRFQRDCTHMGIHDDRIVIESPGRFLGMVDPANRLSVECLARNPRIAPVCTDLRITQEFGEGIRRMFDELRAAGRSDPLCRQTAGSVQLALFGEPAERRLANVLRHLNALRGAGYVPGVGKSRKDPRASWRLNR